MKNTIITTLFSLIMLQFCLGQGVGFGTTAPDASAAVDISSTTKGILVPRMTTAQRNMIASPATGLLVFDLTSNSFWFRNTNSWVELVDSVKAEVHRSGPDKIYLGMVDKVGVGTNNPSTKLQVKTGNESYGISHTNGTVEISTFTGNTGGWIGTTSNHPFYLYSNNGAYQATLLPNGNFGIGTPNPLTSLHVEGNGYFNGFLGLGISNPFNMLDIALGSGRTGTHPTNLPLYVTGNIGAESNGIEFRHENGTQGIGFGYNTIYGASSTANQNLGLAAKGSNGYLFFKTNGAERMRINENGNVGIGITTPNAPLQFSNAVQNRKLVLYDVSNNDNQFFGFGINGATLRYQTGDPGSDHVFFAGTSSSTSSELMRIKGNGNVGIGTATPNAQLQFNNAVQNRKLVLYEAANDEHQFFGFGINPDGTLRYQTPVTDNDHAFYAGTSSTTSVELMRIKGNGNIGIGTPSPDQRLSVNNKFGVDNNGSIHVKNTTRQFYFYEDELSSKMILSHSPTYPTWGLQYTATNKFRFLKDSLPVMTVDLGGNNVEVNGALKIGHLINQNGPSYVGANSAGYIECGCPPGTVVLGGGFGSPNTALSVTRSYPASSSVWRVEAFNQDLFNSHPLTAYAICARLAN